MATETQTVSEFINEPYKPIYNPFNTKPVLVNQSISYDRDVFTERPWLGPLLFDNSSSDARDHCANERTFLSWLRLSVYMAVVSVAIMCSFHLKKQPTRIERKMALPLGILFWSLAMACMISGVASYCRTVTRYSRRAALVQSGWKTEVVFTIVATAIVGACVLFISTNATTRSPAKTMATKYIVEVRCRDNTVEVRCRDTMVEVRCGDNMAEVRCRDTMAEVRCRDTMAKVRCRDAMAEVRCRGNIVEVRCRDNMAPKSPKVMLGNKHHPPTCGLIRRQCGND
ncbi:hypothetical protein E2P81_ATG04538 [Venturia nashicola]|uniref:DUF202 domain-containing protein n=1 Tax=Venturia nashicola TaxID=86259 RepID=A0A4Z1P8M4_9PEZI|nr:hypothetical protein E6O75_ATG04646 [Venturia nashicola]TLD34373.1 hypothetical protein E2P81_ATG04538 [Venturia nashicola]